MMMCSFVRMIVVFLLPLLCWFAVCAESAVSPSGHFAVLRKQTIYSSEHYSSTTSAVSRNNYGNDDRNDNQTRRSDNNNKHNIPIRSGSDGEEEAGRLAVEYQHERNLLRVADHAHIKQDDRHDVTHRCNSSTKPAISSSSTKYYHVPAPNQGRRRQRRSFIHEPIFVPVVVMIVML
mmetsp:Transcript_24475/g.27395  ORF Transcript_24475/g.27395 Transcript_24475/m.27395 type:complete len:177 (-) Transcript_24475:190-720(-)